MDNVTKTSEMRPVVHGRWLKDKHGRAICSECKNRAYILLDTKTVRANYCPICGAMLDPWKDSNVYVKKRDRENT